MALRQYLASPQSSVPELAGVRTAILGSVWVIVITILVAFPLGVGAAIYLEEYADQRKWYNRLIQTNINNLAGVPPSSTACWGWPSLCAPWSR